MARRLYVSMLVLACVVGVRADGANASQDPTAGAAISPSWQTGLFYKLYQLKRRPKQVRNVLPGVAPAAVGVVESLDLSKKEQFSGKTDSVQVEYYGDLYLPATGEYTFEADSDDGLELYLNERFVMKDAWVNGSKPANRVTVDLEEGWAPIHVRFYQGDGGYRVSVKWRPPGAAGFTDIPTTALRHDATAYHEAVREMEAEASNAPLPEELAYRAIFKTQGFFELPEHEGDLLVELLEGPTHYSKQARKDMNSLLKATHYDELPYWHQVKVLAGYLRGWYAGSTYRDEPAHRSAFEIDAVERVEAYKGWRGAERSGFRHVVHLDGGHMLTIFTPEADSPERQRVAKAIAGLPEALQPLIRTVKVEPYGTASEYNGGGDTIWVRLQGPAPQKDLDDTFAHEIGHLIMNKTDCYLPWQEAIGKEMLSLSHYGRLNPSEDFAEFTRLYISTESDEQQIASLQRLFPYRYAVFSEAMGKVSESAK